MVEIFNVNVCKKLVFPDIEIKPTLPDRFKGDDLELKWVLNDIESSKDLLKTTK